MQGEDEGGDGVRGWEWGVRRVWVSVTVGQCGVRRVWGKCKTKVA